MKYWTELNGIDTQIARLESMRALISVLASGAEESSAEDVRSALWYIEGSMTSIHQELRSEFNELWDVIRDESFESEKNEPEKKHKGGMKKKKMMTDRELP